MDISSTVIDHDTGRVVKPISRRDIFYDYVAERFGPYVAYVLVYSFSLVIYTVVLMTSLFVSLEFVRYRDVEADVSNYATAVYTNTIDRL